MATATQSTLVAVFKNRTDAEAAANELKANGFNSNDVYIGSYNNAGTAEGPREWTSTQHHEGGIKGWFKSLFGEHDESPEYDQYENTAKKGNVILTVNADTNKLDAAERILQKYNPVDVDQNETRSTAGNGRATTGARTKTTASTSKKTGSTTDLPKSIPVVQEDVSVGKRPVVRGEVRVYSRVVQTPVQESVNLREEHVRVERQPVNRPAQAGDMRGTDEVIEVQEYAEEPVVQKQARVVEEVRINKDVTERTETVRDTVRRQDVQVDDTTKRTGTGTTDAYDEDFRRDFQSRYGNSGYSYDDYAPAYRYGYTAASDPRYQGRSWNEVEPDLRTDYTKRYPNSTWDRIKDSIRYGWDKVTGRARTATAHGD